MTVNITTLTKQGFIEAIDSLTERVRVQTSASSYNPVGLVSEMTLVAHGVSMALEAPGNVDSIMAFNVATHARADTTKESYLLIGYSASALGQVDWEASVLHVGVGLSTVAAADHTLLASSNITIINGYTFVSFTIPAAPADTRIMKIGVKRKGATDANTGLVHIEGVVVDYPAIGELA
jgi:hypothetical protein